MSTINNTASQNPSLPLELRRSVTTKASTATHSPAALPRPLPAKWETIKSTGIPHSKHRSAVRSSGLLEVLTASRSFPSLVIFTAVHTRTLDGWPGSQFGYLTYLIVFAGKYSKRVPRVSRFRDPGLHKSHWSVLPSLHHFCLGSTLFPCLGDWSAGTVGMICTSLPSAVMLGNLSSRARTAVICF
jgi:hypothetical protein